MKIHACLIRVILLTAFFSCTTASHEEEISAIVSTWKQNEGFTNFMTGFVRQGNGVIVMTTGDKCGRLTGEILRSV